MIARSCPIGRGSPSFFRIQASSSIVDQHAAATGEGISVTSSLIPTPVGYTRTAARS